MCYLQNTFFCVTSNSRQSDIPTHLPWIAVLTYTYNIKHIHGNTSWIWQVRANIARTNAEQGKLWLLCAPHSLQNIKMKIKMSQYIMINVSFSISPSNTEKFHRKSCLLELQAEKCCFTITQNSDKTRTWAWTEWTAEKVRHSAGKLTVKRWLFCFLHEIWEEVQKKWLENLIFFIRGRVSRHIYIYTHP